MNQETYLSSYDRREPCSTYMTNTVYQTFIKTNGYFADSFNYVGQDRKGREKLKWVDAWTKTNEHGTWTANVICHPVSTMDNRTTQHK